MFNFHTQPYEDLTISPKKWLISELLNIQLCVPGKHWFYYGQRYNKTRLFSFPWVEKDYSNFQGGERRKTG